MNEKLLLEAFEWAKEQDIQMGRNAFRWGDSFCAVGLLALYVGFPKERMTNNSLNSDATDIEDRWNSLKKHYGLVSLAQITVLNDYHWKSWDDAIEWVKKYGEENASNS